MDRIRVNTDALEECASTIRNCGDDVSSLANEIQSILADLPEGCERYRDAIQNCRKDALLISDTLDRLDGAVRKVSDLFIECEEGIRSNGRQETGTDGITGSGGNPSVINRVFTWVDGVLESLGINKYIDNMRQKKQDRKMRNEIQTLVSNKYTQKKWKKASVEERKEMLNQMLRDLNGIYGTNIEKDINFYTEKADSKGMILNGYYSDNARQVSINTEILSKSDYKNALSTMVHEMRHAYQHEVIRHPDRFIVSKDNVQAWENNFQNYISYSEEKNNYNEYRNQPIEKDARDMENSIRY